MQRASLPYDAAAEDVAIDPELPFLDAFVQQARHLFWLAPPP